MKNPPIQISWQAGAPPPELDETALCSALREFLTLLGFGASGLSVLIADDESLRVLNAEHRGLDRPTDILSWSYLEDAAASPELLGPELLGELAVSLESAQAQARRNGWDTPTEMLRLLAHGCAHLAGHDHQTEEGERNMRAVEITLLERVGLRNIYPES